ncbi:topoisomerase DNA-binding C4 zinc finger domain-containing protein [Helicobacter pylori]|nr:topoisomerase DNA-binding C4 zinc finger domain-containing protein [Helicobacter pylori]
MSLATSYNVSNNFSKFNIKRVREYLICLVCNTPKMIQRELNGVSFYGCSNYVNKGDCKGVLREINGSMKMVCLASVKADIKENSFFLGCKNYLKCKWIASVDSQDPKCPKCNRLMKRKKNFKNNEFFTAISLILNAMEFCFYINLKKKETNV